MESNAFQKYKVLEDSFFKINEFIGMPGCFLDRDGVLIKDKHYIKKKEDVELESGVKVFLENLKDNKIPVVIVTNQSGIARGITSWEDYYHVTARMLELIGSNSPIIGIFANSYIRCSKNNWRKPNPYMINYASKIFGIRKSNSIMIGDRCSDLLAGSRARIGTLIHLETGHGRKERRLVKSYSDKDRFIHNDNFSKLYFFKNLSEIPVKIFKNK